jgi:hypothetical protein
MSAIHPTAAEKQTPFDAGFVPILLQKSFCTLIKKISGP